MSIGADKWGPNNNVDELYELFIQHYTPQWERLNIVDGIGDNYFCSLLCKGCKCESFCTGEEFKGNWYFEDDELEQFKKDRPELFI